MVKIDEQIRQLVVSKLMDGYSQVSVAAEVNIGQTTVSYIWRKYRKTRIVADAKRSGRPRKATERERRLLSMTSKRNPFLTAREVRNEAKILSDVSLTTIKRYLRESNLHGRVAAKKPLLNKVQTQKRKKWCQAYSVFSTADWSKVIYSDECRIENYSSRRTFVRRPINQRFKSRYVLKTVKYGGFSVLVWGLIKSDGTRVLIRCPQILNSVAYQSVLDRGLLGAYHYDEIFMQDGAPCHRSASTLRYLDSKNICVMSDWPPQSPDLNIIEHMWSILKVNVGKRYVMNADQLWASVKAEWDRIPNKIIEDLYGSIPRRLKLILKNKGLHSYY